MTEKEMMLFAYQQSPEPVIKNRVLSDALDKDLGPRNNYNLGLRVTKALNKIKPYGGATTVGKSSPKLNRKPELNFIKLFDQLKDKNFAGNLKKTSESIGQSPEKIKGIFTRTLGPGSKSSGHKPVISIPEPKNGIFYSQTTTNMKSNPDAFRELITPQTKELYLSPKDIASKLGINFKGDKGQYDFFVKDLKDLKVTNKASSGKQKLFSFDDATNKILNKYKTKKIKGERLADSNRLEIEKKLDLELYKVRNNNKQRIKTISKNENIYLTNSIDDVGHTVSIKITDKYPRLFKDSNVNNINSLVYQDPYLNQDVMKLTGYETRFDSMFKELETLVNKPVTAKTQKKILDIKKSMNQNYNGLIKNLTDPVALKFIMNRSGRDISPSHLKTLSQQTNRIPKIDIKVPKIGEKFLSKNIYADMSKVDPQYIMGYVNKINPTAKKFKDLSLSEQKLYQENLLDQSGMIVGDYYKKVGYPKGQLDELQEAVTYDNYASGGEVKRTGFAKGTNFEQATKRALQIAKLPVKAAQFVGGTLEPFLEYALARPYMQTGDIEGAKGATTAGLFGAGDFDVESIKESYPDAYQYLKDGQAREQYGAAANTIDELAKGLKLGSQGDTADKLLRIETFIDEAKKNGTFDKLNPNIIKQFESAKSKMNFIVQDYQNYGYTEEDSTKNPSTGKVAFQKFMREKQIADYENKINKAASVSAFENADQDVVKENIKSYDTENDPRNFNKITDLKSFIEAKGEPMLGNENFNPFTLKPGLADKASRYGVDGIFDNFVLGMDTEYAGGKEIEDLYSELPIEYASQLASLEKEDYEKGLAAIEQKKTDEFISQTEGAAEGGIMSLKRKK